MEQVAIRTLPRWRSHKVVTAAKIREVQPFESAEPNGTGAFLILDDPVHMTYVRFRVTAEYLAKHNPQAGGYFVVYEDGYQSFSPAKAFEGGYTLITEAEPTAVPAP